MTPLELDILRSAVWALRHAAQRQRIENAPDQIAAAVADWLDLVLETHLGDPDDFCAGKGHGGQPCNSWWCENVINALAVAKAVIL